MTDKFSKKKRSEMMSKIHSVSSIERVPRFLSGFNMRRQPKNVFGRPDFANKSRKVALFIDGCFFHGCKKHFKCPETNPEFWQGKIDRNRKRDREVTEKLESEGWHVYRIWECELRKME